MFFALNLPGTWVQALQRIFLPKPKELLCHSLPEMGRFQHLGMSAEAHDQAHDLAKPPTSLVIRPVKDLAQASLRVEFGARLRLTA